MARTKSEKTPKWFTGAAQLARRVGCAYFILYNPQCNVKLSRNQITQSKCVIMHIIATNFEPASLKAPRKRDSHSSKTVNILS